MTTVPGTAPPPVQHAFTSHDGLQIFGHLSLPPGPGPHPVVLVHTADRGGALDDERRYAKVAEHPPLLAAGFAVFTVDQRGASGHGDGYRQLQQFGGAEVGDILAAGRYVARLPFIDGGRVAILGASRGACTALLALTSAPDLFRAGVLLMGIYEPALYMKREKQQRPTSSPIYQTMGDWDVAERWFSALERQPLRAIERVKAPLYAIHGNTDRVVGVEQARRLQAATDEAGVSLQLDLVQDLGHDIGYEHPVWPKLWARIASFLHRHVGPPPERPAREALAGVDD